MFKEGRPGGAMKAFLVGALLAANWLSGTVPAIGAMLTYDISVSSPPSGQGWYGGTLGLPGLPIAGTLTVDNQSGQVDNFALAAGPTHWTQADFTTTPALSFDSAGNLVSFNLYQSLLAPYDNYTMTLRDEHFEISDPANNYAGCYACVDFGRAPVPVPTGAWLLLSGLGGFGGLLSVRWRRALGSSAV